MLATYGRWTADDLAELNGSTAKNRHQLASRWTREGKIFGVPHDGRTVYPAFQFDDDFRPRPIISEVLAALPREHMSAWGVGLWFYAPNGALKDTRRPADLIGTPDEELILGAALRLAEPLPL